MVTRFFGGKVHKVSPPSLLILTVKTLEVLVYVSVASPSTSMVRRDWSVSTPRHGP